MKTDYTLKLNTKYEIMTPNGYKSFGGIRKLIKSDYYEIHLSNGYKLKCSTNHKFIKDGAEIDVSTINAGDYIDGDDNKKVFIQIKEYKTENITLFDIVEVDSGNIFNVDGIVSHNCDFISSGATVIAPELLIKYTEAYVKDPMYKRGFDNNLWVWEDPNYARSYIVTADVARGDGEDYSTCHVIDAESCEQVAEYKGKIEPKDFGNFLINLATEYNDALLIIDNASIGWTTIQQCLDRNYKNLFWSNRDVKYVDIDTQFTNKFYRDEKQMVPGFSISSKTRPLVISKIDTYMRDMSVIIRSKRTIDEFFTFIWHNGRAEAARGYNDDLVMALGMGLWIRDTALRLRQEGIDLTRRSIDGFVQTSYDSLYTPGQFADDPYKMQTGKNDEFEDLRWLLR